MKHATLKISKALITASTAIFYFVYPANAEFIELLNDIAVDAVEEVAEIVTDKSVQELPAGRIFLKNGDKLRGKALDLDGEQNLYFESSKLKSKAKFPTDEIISVKLDKNIPDRSEETLARVELNNRYNEPYGDILIGKLSELTPESIVLETAYAGKVTIQRPMVKSFKMITNKPGHYHGPNNLDEWQRSKSKSSWTFQENSLVSKYNNDLIGKDVSLQSSSRISFQLIPGQNFQLGLTIFSSNPDEHSPDYGCKLTLRYNSAQIYLLGDARGNNGPAARANYQIDNTKKVHQFDVFVDAQQGIYTIFINDKKSAVLQSAPLDINPSRGGITFTNAQNIQLKLKNITVQPWDGHFLIIEKSDSDSTEPHNIVLKNGDQVPGIVGKVEDEHILIETKYSPIKIPLERIESFSLENEGVQPIMKQGDVCLWFNVGGHLILKPSSITKEKVTGFGQAFGDLEIDISSISRIDFNIYDDSLHSTRIMAN